MGKKKRKSTDPGKMHQTLEHVLAELAATRVQLDKLSKRQKKTLRELNALKNAYKEIRLCKRKTGKKASRKTKKPCVSTVATGEKHTTVIPLAMSNSVASSVADDLKLISGVGPKLEKTLNGLGISRYNQIAEWGADEVARINDHLRFSGRIQRENWIEQAKALAKGGRDEYVKVFGKEPR